METSASFEVRSAPSSYPTTHYTRTKYAIFVNSYAVSVGSETVSRRRYLRYTTPNHDSPAPEDSRRLSLIDAGAALHCACEDWAKRVPGGGDPGDG